MRRTRLSLAERVAKLEQQAQGRNNASANIDLVNQINALQSQVQTLQGQIEELRHQLEASQARNKDQYIDLDSRMARLEGRGGTGAAAMPAAPSTNTGQLQDITLGGGDGRGGRAAAGRRRQCRSRRPQPAAGYFRAGACRMRRNEKADYDQAFNALKDGRYAESARRFQGFIDQYPNSDLTPNAFYWLGESYYVTRTIRSRWIRSASCLRSSRTARRRPMRYSRLATASTR